MRNTRSRFCLFAVALLALMIFSSILLGQNFDYQREEGPAMSWNRIPFYDACMLGSGGVSFFASPTLAAYANPAHAIERTAAIAVSGAYISQQAFQYWGYNQGVWLNGPELMNAQSTLTPSAITVTLPLSFCDLSAGWIEQSLLRLPDFTSAAAYQTWHASFVGQFSGREHAFYIALAKALGQDVRVGFRLSYIYGVRDAQVTYLDAYSTEFAEVGRRESERSRQWIPAFGVQWTPTPQWAIAAAAEVPLRGSADRTLQQWFTTQLINITGPTQSASDCQYRPAYYMLSASYCPDWLPHNALTIASEARYTRWSTYQYQRFGENMPRNMRDTWVWAVGASYILPLETVNLTCRCGYRLDNQPLTDPQTTLHALTAGIGLAWPKLTCDWGLYYAFAATSAASFHHLALAATVATRL